MCLQKRANRVTKLLTIITFSAFLLVSLMLPWFSFKGYSMLAHTTSHLGAQHSPHAWLMNVVFFMLGATSLYVTNGSRPRLVKWCAVGFGLSMILVAFFRHAPLLPQQSIDYFQDDMHTLFATTAGVFFSLHAFGHAVANRRFQRVAAGIMSSIAIVIPLLMAIYPNLMGLLQRIMFTCCFGWLFFIVDYQQAS